MQVPQNGTAKKWQKAALLVCCLAGMGISFLYHLFSFEQGPDDFRFSSQLNAPIQLNIEIDNNYASSVSIVVSRIQDDSVTDVSVNQNNQSRNVIVHSQIGRFVRGISLRIPKDTAEKTLNAIDGISIFIGNRLFYFSPSDIAGLQGRERSNYMIYELPGLVYNRSVIASLLPTNLSFVSYYGDLNVVVKTVALFAANPGGFVITWFFIFFLLALLRPNITRIYQRLEKKKQIPELLLLGLILFVAFMFHFNGYDRHSSWLDELYSIFVAANPALPFGATFGDPGNPPLYNILLRFWFIIFGWTEQSGRFFSVLIGTATIVPFYALLKRFANQKAAFLAAFYMAVSGWLIGFSQEIRNYILVVFLVLIVVNRFCHIIETRKLTTAAIAWYVIPSILLVNTHYYGSLFVFVNFLFFAAYSIMTKAFTWKSIMMFFTANVIIAISLLPYFILTALSGALFNPDFNTWISRPGTNFMVTAALIPFFAVAYIYLRKTIFKNGLAGSRTYFIDYLIFTAPAVFIIAFGISMHRSILIPRYLVILYPLIIAVLAIVFVYVFSHYSKSVGAICFIFMFSWLINGFQSPPGGGKDVFYESLAYITQDAAAHPARVSLEITPQSYHRVEHFYGYVPLPGFFSGDEYDVLYFNPTYRSQAMFGIIEGLGIDRDRVLQIHTNKQAIFKIYSEALSDR